MTVTRRETLRELRKELVTAKRRVSQVEAAIRALEVLDGDVSGETPKAKGKSGELSEMTYTDAAYAVLKKAGKPLIIATILEAMAHGGRPIESSKPYRTLYKALKAADTKFKNNHGQWSAI